MENTKQEKMPLRTVNGHKCLTKCFPKNTPYLHPITLNKLPPMNINSCAIEPIIKKGGIIDYEECKIDQNNTYSFPSEKDSVLLDFKFVPSEFLADTYDIHSFNEVISWTLENRHSHFDTIKRVHNAAWKAYGSNLDNISELVINFYYDIAKNNWMLDFIDMINKKYSFDISETENLTNVSNVSGPNEEINVIINNFFTEDFFTQIIKKYVSTYKSEWLQIDSHYGNLKKFTYKCLVKNIQYKSANKTTTDINLFNVKI